MQHTHVRVLGRTCVRQGNRLTSSRCMMYPQKAANARQAKWGMMSPTALETQRAHDLRQRRKCQPPLPQKCQASANVAPMPCWPRMSPELQYEGFSYMLNMFRKAFESSRAWRLRRRVRGHQHRARKKGIEGIRAPAFQLTAPPITVQLRQIRRGKAEPAWTTRGVCPPPYARSHVRPTNSLN